MKIKLFLIFLLCSFITGCGLETKTLSEFYEKGLEDVTQINILDGSTGYKKIIKDKELIDDFLSQIKDTQFIPEKNQEDQSGFTYSLSLHQEGEFPFRFSLSSVNDHYYYTHPDLFPIVDDFYKNLEVQEE
ncbi:hypothetical protein [Cytobacillus gottheilii]|uniref:hypothetical protein n=1 Tax=Cytobacillus gottheilii TaxID=859144 RepID=UPI0009BB7FBD|nr:hypothetical protein [Cytobacillus gottheilii]